ncbi:2-hydroxyacid dehydrogenase [Amycolatopsis mongoliensis]|uniref:2-hydroxyacid dehydrogenase n=1 Tax=Amycolatopsis mongoliensis TaxID=715475 RepID=A0A9Y2JNF5_9PSEU|nr:2-hydroxyacid dehydrogenase [Amycolatopsis sp. 4-36]WIY00910.1 2-hydroxyacid dehydrogenase [Amycolatopsis sp. 4-36]
MKIVIADTNLASVRAELEAGFPPGSATLWPDPRDSAAVEAAVADAEVLVSSRCSSATAAAAKNLRLVHAAGAGVDGIDVAALVPGTIVANTHHHEDSIAEYAVAAAILLRRGFLAQDEALRRDEWASPVYRSDAPWRDSLGAATVGFIGFGHIGAQAWSRFRAFGARGVAVTRSGDVDAVAFGLDWSGAIDDLGSLLETADVIVVSVPLTAATTGLIGADELARTQAGTVVINVGRGPVIDERALYEALRDKVIAAAALDVWYGYPEHGATTPPAALPFRDLPNVLMTPHSSGLTRQTFAGRAADIAANVRRLAAGEPLTGVVAVAE